MSLVQVHPSYQWKRRDLNPGPSDSKACLCSYLSYYTRKERGDADWSMIPPFKNDLDSRLGERVLGATLRKPVWTKDRIAE